MLTGVVLRTLKQSLRARRKAGGARGGWNSGAGGTARRVEQWGGWNDGDVEKTGSSQGRWNSRAGVTAGELKKKMLVARCVAPADAAFPCLMVSTTELFCVQS